jgi:hypothetical protein
MGFEPMMRVLQTLALPLGHVALRKRIIKLALSFVNQMTSSNKEEKMNLDKGFIGTE